MDFINKQDLINLIKQNLVDSINIKQQILNNSQLIESLLTMSQIITHAISNGNKLMLCGNGGSASDSQHLATELLVRFRSTVNRGSLPAIALTMDPTVLTAIGNDYSFAEIFSRPLAGLGKRGDVLLGITTSGRSNNILQALKLARSMGIITLGFLGWNGEPAKLYCDHSFIVPSEITARIQEIHITAGHIMIELIENALLLSKINRVGTNINQHCLELN